MKYTSKRMSRKAVDFENQRFEHYAATRKGRLDQRAKEAWELFHNDRDGTDTQYTRSQIEMLEQVGAPHVSMNFMYPILSHQKGVLTADPPMGRVVPDGATDKQKAYLYEKLCDAVWRRSKARAAYAKCVKEMLIVYYSALHVEPVSFYRPGMFDLTIGHTSWEDLYIDPDARESGLNFRDAECMYVAKIIPERKVKNIYGVGVPANQMLLHSNVFDRDEELDNRQVLIRDVYEKEYGIYLIIVDATDPMNPVVTRKVVSNEREMEKWTTGPFAIQAAREGVYVRRRTILGDDVELANVFLPLTEYPFAILTADDYINPFGKAPAEFLREMQKAMNKFWQIVVLNAMLASNTRFMGPKGSFVDKDAWTKYAAVAGHTYEYIADSTLPNGGKPEIIAPLPLNSAFYQLAEQLKAMGEYTTGTHPFQMGDPNSAPNTANAGQQLQAAGTIRLRDLKARIGMAIGMGLWIPVIQYINHYGSRDQIIRYIDDSEELQEIPLDQILDDSTIEEFDIQTGIKTSLPTDRERLLMLLQTFIGQVADPGLQRVALEETLKLQDWPVFETLSKKFDIVREQQGQMQQQQETIEKLQALVDRLSTEVIIGKEKVEIEKFKGDMGVLRAQTEAKAQVALGKLQNAESVEQAVEEL